MHPPTERASHQVIINYSFLLLMIWLVENCHEEKSLKSIFDYPNRDVYIYLFFLPSQGLQEPHERFTIDGEELKLMLKLQSANVARLLKNIF